MSLKSKLGSVLAVLIALGCTGCFDEKGTIANAQSASSFKQEIEPDIGTCVNLGNALDAPKEGDWGYVIEDKHLVDIANAGIDAIRLPVKWSAHTQSEPPYEIYPQFFERVDHVLNVALGLGLKVIIDVHHYDELMERPRVEYPRFLSIWHQISARYGHKTDRLIFEVINEPNSKMDKSWVEKANQDVLDIIRVNQPHRWVIFSGLEWGGFDGLKGMSFPEDQHTLISYHFYDPFEFTHQGASWTYKPFPEGVMWGSAADIAKMDAHFKEVEASDVYQRRKLFLGEFGAIYKADTESRAAYTQAVRERAEEMGINWCHWDFAAAFPIYDRNTGKWIEELKVALFGN